MVVFDPWPGKQADSSPPPGLAPFRLSKGTPPQERAIAFEQEGRVVIDTGKLQTSIPLSNPADVNERVESILTDVCVESGGDRLAVTGGRLDAGLVVKEHDGRVFSNQRAEPNFTVRLAAQRPGWGVSIIEPGPVRALVRAAGKTVAATYYTSLDYVIYLEAYRNRSLVRLQVSWLHADDEVAHWVRDIRFRVPLAFQCEEARFGVERGFLTEALQPGRECFLLQDDDDQCWALRRDWDGELIDMGHGAGNGRTCPGWAQISGQGRAVSLYVPNFVQEYPNEIRVSSDTLSVGLWPQEANAHIASKRLLPPNPSPDPERRHKHERYENLIHHPYWAFFCREHTALETVRGMQKTQDIYLDFDPSLDVRAWRDQVQAGLVQQCVATVEPERLRTSGAFGLIAPFGGAASAEADAALERAAEWFHRHGSVFRVFGKFDYGDLRYIVASPFQTEYRHISLKTHPRAGYWNNNENDPIHGLFLHFLRTGQTRHLRLCLSLGRHMWDVDVCHYSSPFSSGSDEPSWGLHTHCFGHCFRSLTHEATDHLWTQALIDYYLLTGNPDALRGVEGIGRLCLDQMQKIRAASWDLRAVAIAIIQAAALYDALPARPGNEPMFLEQAKDMARQMMAEQLPDGYFPWCGHEAWQRVPDGDRPDSLFGVLALEALQDLDRIEPDDEIRRAFLRQVDWFIDRGMLPAGDGLSAFQSKEGASPEAMRGLPVPPSGIPLRGAGWRDALFCDFQFLRVLAYASKITGNPRYLDVGHRILERLLRLQCGPEHGPEYEGNWPESVPIAEAPSGRSEPALSFPPGLPVPPSGIPLRGAGSCARGASASGGLAGENPAQIRPLVAASALRCLPEFLAALREREAG
jgi:hypothetical protein